MSHLDNKLLPEIARFESLLNEKQNSQPGLDGFFNQSGITVTRVPARLDIMGGIADYSGSNVCEGTLGCGIAMAIQPRKDRTIRIRTLQMGAQNLAAETGIPLDLFNSNGEYAAYGQIRSICRSNPLAAWSAYIVGSIFVLLKEHSMRLYNGLNIFLLSGVPMNSGISSSAAVEISTLYALQNYLKLDMPALRMAELGQLAENMVVGAPCGAMDQITVAAGRHGKLLHILCRPGSIAGEISIPRGAAFAGINSMVRHSVAGRAYGDVRTGAFMGKRIINAARASKGEKEIQYLTELGAAEFEKKYRGLLPETISGSGFLKKFRTHEDPATEIRHDRAYRVAGPTAHPVHENQRVLGFIQALKTAKDEKDFIKAGTYMFACHESYGKNCRLSVPETDYLVDCVKKRVRPGGLYGAKITGGGSGGTVAVFGSRKTIAKEIRAVADEYEKETGLKPDVFSGTSPGAEEFGALAYRKGKAGWKREI